MAEPCQAFNCQEQFAILSVPLATIKWPKIKPNNWIRGSLEWAQIIAWFNVRNRVKPTLESSWGMQNHIINYAKISLRSNSKNCSIHTSRWYLCRQTTETKNKRLLNPVVAYFSVGSNHLCVITLHLWHKWLVTCDLWLITCVPEKNDL